MQDLIKPNFPLGRGEGRMIVGFDWWYHFQIFWLREAYIAILNELYSDSFFIVKKRFKNPISLRNLIF